MVEMRSMRPANSSLFAFFASVTVVALSTLSACKSPPPELDPSPPTKDPATDPTTRSATTTATATATVADQGGMAPKRPAAGGGGGDPLNGSFTLADATKDLKGNGPIVAKIETSKGTLQCRLLDDKAPNTVANFIGLATGKRTWKDPGSGQWVNKPAYDGTTFHRVIKGFMIQGGDPKGNGSGEPGYVIKDEIWDGAHHDKVGQLCMANRGPNTNGAQFFIMDAPTAHLDGGYTIFGECAPDQTVHDIANVPTGAQDKPQTPVVIKSVTISRDEKKK
jgi:peptidyl-prolyl cis-trans isomerase A (cyclophilin A)